MNVVALRRQLVYILAMVALLVPLYMLGRPSVRKKDGSAIRDGGTLAQLRSKYDLGQGDLGEIDPASESMRLATLGLRGVAATILWQRAEYYKKEKYWDRLSATLNQIAVLQPHFVKVWEFQSHNLSYNISVEFDDYRQRYEWVKRGIEYLVKGSKYNKKRTEMPYELGWFFGNKMGVADEKKQFRELYRNDNNFHAEIAATSMDLTNEAGLGPDKKPDNWLSGRLYYERAYEMVKEGARPARSPLMFYRMSSSWLTKYAEGLQAEGELGDAARVAWRRAAAGLKIFGDMPIQTTFGDEITLNVIGQANQDLIKSENEFREYCGATYQKMLDSRRSQLTQDQLAALDVEDYKRNFDQLMLAEQASSVLTIDPKEVVNALPSEEKVKGFQLAERIRIAKEYIQHVEIYRNQINYGYWKSRCDAEQEDAAIAARTNMYDANKLLDKGDLDAALVKYDVAWKAWNDLFNKYPAMMIDDAADDVEAAIDRYRRLLETPDLPKDFPLASFLKFRAINKDNMADPALMSLVADWTTRHPGRDFLTEMLQKSSTVERPSTPPTEEPPIPPRDGTENPASPDAKPAAATLELAPISDAPVVTPETPATNNAPPTVEETPTVEVTPPDEGVAPVPAAKAKSGETSGDSPAATEEVKPVTPPDEGTPPAPVPK